MKLLLTLTLFLAAAPAFAQTPLSNGLKVNGVGLGATYQAVIRKFGKPLKETNRKGDECVGGEAKTLKYAGLKFELNDNDPGKFTVNSFEVTAAAWDVSGAKIGETTAAIKKRFGNRSSEETLSGQRVWYYEMGEDSPGSSNFHFRNGKLVKIQSVYEMC